MSLTPPSGATDAGFSVQLRADGTAAPIVALATLCFCVYLQRLYFVSVRQGYRTFPRAPFYLGVAVLLAIVLVAYVVSPHLP